MNTSWRWDTCGFSAYACTCSTEKFFSLGALLQQWGFFTRIDCFLTIWELLVLLNTCVKLRVLQCLVHFPLDLRCVFLCNWHELDPIYSVCSLKAFCRNNLLVASTSVHSWLKCGANLSVLLHVIGHQPQHFGLVVPWYSDFGTEAALRNLRSPCQHRLLVPTSASLFYLPSHNCPWVFHTGHITELSQVKKSPLSLQNRSLDQFIDSFYGTDLQQAKLRCAAGTGVGTRGWEVGEREGLLGTVRSSTSFLQHGLMWRLGANGMVIVPHKVLWGHTEVMSLQTVL